MKKKELKFKIIYGYDPADYFTIGTDELLKAYYSFLNETKLILKSGEAIKGKEIKRIQPDYNAYAGYVKGYKMRPADYDDIPGYIQKKATLIGSRTRTIVADILKIKSIEERTRLMALPLPDLHRMYFDKDQIGASKDIKKLSEKLKM